MKEKIILFIIGILVGAVLATGAFYIYSSTTNTCVSDSNNMGMTPPEMPGGQNGEPPEMPGGQNGEPPEKPEGEPGEMPNGNNQNNN